jgi:hypothetical protein
MYLYTSSIVSPSAAFESEKGSTTDRSYLCTVVIVKYIYVHIYTYIHIYIYTDIYEKRSTTDRSYMCIVVIVVSGLRTLEYMYTYIYVYM